MNYVIAQLQFCNSCQQVGPVCEALKPCGDTILCKDSCDPPYYKCVHCDNDHMGLHCDVPIGRLSLLPFLMNSSFKYNLLGESSLKQLEQK